MSLLIIVLVGENKVIIVVELEDVGEKRMDSEEDRELLYSDVEEEKELVDDPYQKWFNKRLFTDQDKQNADAVLLE